MNRTRWHRIGIIATIFIMSLSANGFCGQTPARRAPQPNRAHQPQMDGMLLQKIEAKLGKALTVEQRKELGQAAQTMAAALKAEQQKFIAAIAAASGVTEAQVAEMMPKVGQDNTGFDKNMMPKLETILGRPLTPDELQKIREADDAKKAAMKPIQEKLAENAARISGLKKEDVLEMLPKIGL